jgi:hypothetical protein
MDHIGHLVSHSHISPFENENFLKPYNESFVQTTANVPDETLWIDTCRVIHVSISFNNSCEPLVERIQIFNTPSSPTPESEPSPYIDPDNDSIRQTMMFLPIPDGHQHLLDYFTTDLPALLDEHPILLES